MESYIYLCSSLPPSPQRQLRGHPHIIQLVAAAGSPPSHTSHGNAEFVILTDLCTGQTLL